MEKIGKGFGFILLLGLFFNVLLPNAAAQNEVSVKATVSQSTVTTGGRIKLNITISGDFNEISLPNLPEIEEFQLLSSTPSTSRRFSYINGVSKTSYTYSYFLSAQQKGTFSIPPISVEIDGKQFKTQPVTVNVVGHSANGSASAGEAKIFLKMSVSDHTVVSGEQITANVALYFKNGIQVKTFQPVPGWKAKGFWKEKLTTSKRPGVNTVIIDGVKYNKARLLQFALFPTKEGELTISPYQVNVLVQSISRRNPFSSFFGGSATNRRRLELKTDPITIEVNSLPEADSLAFTGGVGSFTVKRYINADTVQTGKTIEVKTTISGTGNIPLLNKPDYKLPAALEVYQPQTNVKINRKSGRISGTKTFTDLVVPRNPGSVTIPAAIISWYNPQEEEFVEKELPAKTIFVKANLSGTSASSGPGQNMISPITGLANWVPPTPEIQLISRWWFWIGLLLPVIGLVVGYWRKTYNEKMSSNTRFARGQQAREVANKRLQKATEHVDKNQIKQAYHSIEQAITGFIADKLNMPEAGLSIEQYIKALEEQNVNRGLIKNVRTLLNKCATINYAPEKSSDYLKSHINLAKSIIKKLRKEL